MRRHCFGLLVLVLVFFLQQYCFGQTVAASRDLGPGISSGTGGEGFRRGKGRAQSW